MFAPVKRERAYRSSACRNLNGSDLTVPEPVTPDPLCSFRDDDVLQSSEVPHAQLSSHRIWARTDRDWTQHPDIWQVCRAAIFHTDPFDLAAADKRKPLDTLERSR